MKLTKKWFTLVEMLIVIVIIGILAAALIPRLTGIQARARDTGRRADINQLVSAIATYQLDYQTIPSSGGTLSAGVWNNSETVLAELVPTYMNVLPKEAGVGNMRYMYAVTSTFSAYSIAVLSEGGGSQSNWSGADANSGAASVPVSIASYFGGTNATALAAAIASCQAETISDTGCRGNSSQGHSRYLVAN